MPLRSVEDTMPAAVACICHLVDNVNSDALVVVSVTAAMQMQRLSLHLDRLQAKGLQQ